MRHWIARILFVGLAALASTAQGQYPSSGYYGQPQGYRNPSPYPYYPQNPYYYAPQAPRSVPGYPTNWQGLPTSPSWANASDPMAGPSSRVYHAAPQPMPTTIVGPGSGGVIVAPAERPSSKAPRGPASNLRVQPTEEPPVPPITLPAIGKEPTPVQTLPPTVTIPVTTESRRLRVMVFADYLLWNVHGADVPFAQPFDGIDPIFSVPRGAVGVVTPQFQSGFRAGGGVSLSEGNWVVGTFTYFRADKSAQITAADNLVLHNFLAFPNTVNSAVDSLTSQADYHLQLMVADIDYKGALVNNDRMSLSFVAGFRYAHLDQDLLNTFQLTGTTTIDSRISFDGFGPRLGLEGQYRMMGGFYGYAQGMVDLLFGQFRGSYVERSAFTGLVGQTSINQNRPVPVLELELGGGWQSSNGRIRLAGGYYIGSWFNTMTTTSFAGAIGNTNFTTNGNNFRDTIVFDGLVGRFEFRY